MLAALHIQDFILIRQARLQVGPGMTALTGETGAGKSILLDALGLALGARAERGAVRSGAEQCVLTASFEPRSDHAVWALLDQNALPAEDETIILRRVVAADGRSRAFINDQPVSIGMLRQVGDRLLEIHGQHDGRGFLASSAHLGMLDAFGGLEKRARTVGDLYRAWRESEEALVARRREIEAAARETDYLRHVVETLEALDPQADEESELAARRAALMAGERIGEDLSAASDALEEGGVAAKLSIALRNLERAEDRLDPEADRAALRAAGDHLEASLSEAGEAERAIAEAMRVFGVEPAALEAAEERLFALRAEARKHGVDPNALHEFLCAMRAKLDDLSAGEAAFADLEKAARDTQAAFSEAASRLTTARRRAGKKLDAAVASELAPLKLAKAQFATAIQSNPEAAGPNGHDHVEFMVATNPGAPAGPLKSIASGGELSRFVLAMKAALALKENRTVIIFDEVDAGVGGAVADAVGERLARLARDTQVMVVTHSPQVAARADSHWRISKKQAKRQTHTSVEPLTRDARIEEIARMLSGAEVSDEARAAAGRLLNAAPADLAQAG